MGMQIPRRMDAVTVLISNPSVPPSGHWEAETEELPAAHGPVSDL